MRLWGALLQGRIGLKTLIQQIQGQCAEVNALLEPNPEVFLQCSCMKPGLGGGDIWCKQLALFQEGSWPFPGPLVQGLAGLLLLSWQLQSLLRVRGAGLVGVWKKAVVWLPLLPCPRISSIKLLVGQQPGPSLFTSGHSCHQELVE